MISINFAMSIAIIQITVAASRESYHHGTEEKWERMKKKTFLEGGKGSWKNDEEEKNQL